MVRTTTSKKSKDKQVGRPPLYTEWLTDEGLLKIEGWARDGLTMEQISHNIGITSTTLYDWQNKFPELSTTLKKGKEVVDRQVENKLFQRAIGYEYVEQKITTAADGSQRTETVVKHVAPDVTAQIFWLKNRKPAAWRDVRQNEIYGLEGGPIQVANKPDLSKLTEEELANLATIISRTTTTSDTE